MICIFFRSRPSTDNKTKEFYAWQQRLPKQESSKYSMQFIQSFGGCSVFFRRFWFLERDEANLSDTDLSLNDRFTF